MADGFDWMETLTHASFERRNSYSFKKTSGQELGKILEGADVSQIQKNLMKSIGFQEDLLTFLKGATAMDLQVKRALLPFICQHPILGTIGSVV